VLESGAKWESIQNVPPEVPPGTGYRFPKFAEETTIDEKGRVTVLSRDKAFLATLPEKGLLAVTLDNSVALVYPTVFYDEFEKQFERWAARNPEFADAARVQLYKYGCELTIDAADRMLIPMKLREALGWKTKLKLSSAWVKGRLELMKAEDFGRPLGDAAILAQAKKSLKQAAIL
jgi:DNA-binding transcriptional regulator/RsmH inhibitor MraZ